MTDKPIAIGYARVSTGLQAKYGLSLSVQQSKIQHYCLRHGLELVEIVVDEGESGRLPMEKRKKGKRVDRLAREGKVDHVVVASLSRLARSTRETLTLAEDWNDAGVKLDVVKEGLHFDMTTPIGRFHCTMLAAILQMEAEHAAERTREVMAERKANGYMTTATPSLGERIYCPTCGVNYRRHKTRGSLCACGKELRVRPDPIGLATLGIIWSEKPRMGYTRLARHLSELHRPRPQAWRGRHGPTTWSRNSVRLQLNRLKEDPDLVAEALLALKAERGG